MGKSSPSPPPAPDYAGAATAQGAANVEAARATAKLGNPNIIGPYGSQTIKYGAGGSFDEAGYNRAMDSFNSRPVGAAPTQSQFQKYKTDREGENGEYVDDVQAYENALSNFQSSRGVAPTREQYTTGADMDIPTITQTLTPDAMETLKAQQDVQKNLAYLGQQGIGTAQRVMGQPFNYSGPNIQTSLGQQRPLNYGPEMGQYGTAGSVNAGAYGQAGGVNADQYGNLMSRADMSGVAAMPVNAGMTGQQAIMNRLAPQLARQSAATQQQLANQGITSGSEAYRNAMIQEQQGQNDLLSQAALQGIGLDMGANQQGYGQAMGQANLYNQTLGQGFGQASQAQQLQNQAISQNFGQGATAQSQANAAMGQNYGQAGTSAGLFNQAVGQDYNMGLGGAQFGNTAAQQALAQQIALRNQPLNEITGLMSGSQIQTPQFQGYQGANIAAAPIFGAAQAQGQADMQNYGIAQAGANAQMAGLGNLAGTLGGAAIKYGMFASDRRLKSNIVKVGTHPLGIGIYEYDIFGERQRGVMADEVEKVMPEAVMTHESGYKMVDYGALNA